MIAVVRHPITGAWVQVRVSVPDALIQYWNSICEQDPKA